MRKWKLLATAIFMQQSPVVVGGRGLPLLWMGLEHASASVAWEKYSPLLERAKDYLHDFSNIMLLADRGFANQDGLAER